MEIHELDVWDTCRQEYDVHNWRSSKQSGFVYKHKNFALHVKSQLIAASITLRANVLMTEPALFKKHLVDEDQKSPRQNCRQMRIW